MAEKELMEQDLSKLDVAKLHLLSPEVISSQATMNIADLDYIPFKRVRLRKKYKIKRSLLEGGSVHSSSRLVDPQLYCLTCHKSRRVGHIFPFATADDGLTVNASPQASTSEDLRVKQDQPLKHEDYKIALVQSLRDAARDLSWHSEVKALGLIYHGSLSFGSASVYSFLLAAYQISSRGNGKNRDINAFIQGSLSQLSATLESVIKDALSDKQPELCEWFWSQQVPIAVSTFVSNFEEDQQFSDLTGINKGISSSSMDASGKSLPIFVLSLITAIQELGPTKVSSTQFYSVLSDMRGKVMDVLVELIPIRKAYHSIKKIGLRREFLVHFGPRAAACRIIHDQGTEEVLFWVSLVQNQLQRAIGRERIWSRLTSSETIEVLDKDLAIFGFFIALGRKTQQYLYSNNFEAVPEPMEELIRHLIGGSVLYYPQLSAISSYQLYVEVVCEELDWLPFYPGVENLRHSHGHRSKQGPPNEEAIAIALDVSLPRNEFNPSQLNDTRLLWIVPLLRDRYIQSFIKYSKWLENPSNVKAARFLFRGHDILKRSLKESSLPKKMMIENSEANFVKIGGSRRNATPRKDLDSLDKAFKSVDEALLRLEQLLQEREVSSSNSGKEHLNAACSDLEKIRKLKKAAEFLEVSFRAKADSLRQDNTPPEAIEIQRFELIRNELKELETQAERGAKRSNDEQEKNTRDVLAEYSSESKGMQLVKVQEKENFVGKSIIRFKEATTDVLQGTQLLAIDVAAAMGLLIRVLTGDELTEKQKQGLRRTLTDLASAVPIGFLMLLPVTAVGHAAMLAAIQRYIPSLIPSTYGPERLDLLRQLKKVKELDTTDVDPTVSSAKP
ncbi:LETM1-like protein [Tanacetum coccineum]